jgi:signal transduction histidine kinase/DNA-binding NarL/FixJ family response regulator
MTSFALAVMVLLVTVSAWFNWNMSDRVRTISQNQMMVQSASEELLHFGEVMELSAKLAARTGNPADVERYKAAQLRVRQAIEQLNSVIQLKENRVTLRAVSEVDRKRLTIQTQAFALAAVGAREEAASLLEQPRYKALARTYAAGAADIQRRSADYIEETRQELETYLSLNTVSALITFLLVGLTWFLIVRPARRWGREVEELRVLAESATQAKSDFLATVSHEIRTPLNSIIGFTDLLLDDPHLNAGQRHQVELVQNAGAMLLSVVNDVLDISKIEAGKIELLPEPFGLEAFVGNSVSIMRASAEAKGLEMRVSLGAGLSRYYVGDEQRLRQVLINILNNAVKFTQAGSVSLEVTCESSDGDGHIVRFEVTDTGMGISPEQQLQLFHPFSQADASVTRRYGGSGLGLSISRRLLSLMGGEIGVESALGEGSRFWFRLPLRPCEEPDRQEIGHEARVGGRALRILLAEDVPMNQELACAMLGRGGHRVDVASDGEKALRMVQEERYDLVLMDIQMPKMDGLTATRAIRGLGGDAADVPILAMTANVLPEQVREFSRAGMNGHISKPVRRAELEAAIAAAVQPAQEATLAASAAPSEHVFDAAAFEEVQEAIPRERLLAYAEDLDRQVAGLAAADAGSDPAAIVERAHKIVSQAGMLGLVRLSERARAVEESSRNGGEPGSALQSFREAAKDVREQLIPRVGLSRGEGAQPRG